jgi:hypothetical protein
VIFLPAQRLFPSCACGPFHSRAIRRVKKLALGLALKFVFGCHQDGMACREHHLWGSVERKTKPLVAQGVWRWMSAFDKRRAWDSNPQPVTRHLISNQTPHQFGYPPLRSGLVYSLASF